MPPFGMSKPTLNRLACSPNEPAPRGRNPRLIAVAQVNS